MDIVFEHDRLTIYIRQHCVVHRSVLETCWLNAGSMLSPCDPGCNWPSVDEVLRREELLVLLCRRWGLRVEGSQQLFFIPMTAYKYPSTPLGFELLNLQLDLFLKWFVGWKLQGWMALWWWAFSSAECLSQQETIEREFLQKAFFLKILDCCQEELWHKNHFTGGFRWICIIGTSRKSLSHLSKATSRWGSCDTPGQCQDFRCSSRTLASEATFGEEKYGLNTVDGCAESAEKFNMPPCHELLWMLNMTRIIHDVTWHRDRLERTEKDILKLTSMIIPSSLFPVCHGSDFSSSWSYVDLSFSMGFFPGDVHCLPSIFCGSNRRHWATECLWKWLAEGDRTSNPKSWGSLGKCFRRPVGIYPINTQVI